MLAYSGIISVWAFDCLRFGDSCLCREVDVPVHVGYAPQFVPKWDIREVPRPVPKYKGEQQVIEVEVPQIEYKDTYVEKEVVVDVQEKIVPKVTEVVKEVEVMQYEWKEKYQDVPVYKYVPKFDVELDCPPPLIVPYTETRYVLDEPQTSNPFCNWSACCMQVHQEPHIRTVEKAVRTEQQRLYPGKSSAFLFSPQKICMQHMEACGSSCTYFLPP